MKNKNGFTLVELLAVIVILAIILVIAIPKIGAVVNNSKKNSFESSAKILASNAETEFIAQSILYEETFNPATYTVDCSALAVLNNDEYASCSVAFDIDGKARVNLVGDGRFSGLRVCAASRREATALDTAGNCAALSYSNVAW